MKTQTALFAVSMLAAALLWSCGDKPSNDVPTLDDLDRTIKDCPMFQAHKQRHIDSLKVEYNRAGNTREQFDALDALLAEYRVFNSDSALRYCYLRQEIAEHTGDPNDVLTARLNMAEQLGNTGNYLEALGMVDTLNSTDLPDYLRSYLFHIKRTFYGRICDMALRDTDRRKYMDLTDKYRDSLLIVNKDNELVYTLINCDRLNSHGQPEASVKVLKEFMQTHDLSDHAVAIFAYTLSNSYRLLGDTENLKQQLIISSIHDLRSSVKEYIALRELALLLYQEGDVNRAYKYLNQCMQDSRECNARQRIIELNGIFTIVNDVYLDTIESQKTSLKLAFALALLLLLFLAFAVVLVYRQMRKVSAARREVEDMNRQLKDLNGMLTKTNNSLVEANRSIAENSCLKEEYIGRYMDLCLSYIDKLDAYRRSLNKLALADRLDEIKKQTKSVTFIDGELKEFYNNFDDTFLRLFPTFVEDFNNLLRPEERIATKSESRLNPELRIFALIRLGINDSAKIAKFLRYSLTTIYNYRTRIRNKAVNRDSLEDDLMKIGGLSV